MDRLLCKESRTVAALKNVWKINQKKIWNHFIKSVKKEKKHCGIWSKEFSRWWFTIFSFCSFSNMLVCCLLTSITLYSSSTTQKILFKLCMEFLGKIHSEYAANFHLVHGILKTYKQLSAIFSRNAKSFPFFHLYFLCLDINHTHFSLKNNWNEKIFFLFSILLCIANFHTGKMRKLWNLLEDTVLGR